MNTDQIIHLQFENLMNEKCLNKTNRFKIIVITFNLPFYRHVLYTLIT